MPRKTYSSRLNGWGKIIHLLTRGGGRESQRVLVEEEKEEEEEQGQDQEEEREKQLIPCIHFRIPISLFYISSGVCWSVSYSSVQMPGSEFGGSQVNINIC